MARLDFNSLFKNDRYQVFLMSSPASIPVQFARHGWFVINEKGIVSRWEVISSTTHKGLHSGDIYENFSKPFEGVTILPYVRRFSWHRGICLLGTIEGGEGSDAQKMIEIIKDSWTSYPYKEEYHLFGPNSNTYVEWILDRSPEFKHVPLGWRYVGKNFKIRA